MNTVLLPADHGQLGDLARRLRDDTGGSLRAEYTDFFLNQREVTARRLHEALAPGDFELLSAAADAAALSQEVIALVWDALHPHS
ncbi:MAG TPA: hypothetical protein VIT67_06750 [Povalibacter sp.]